MSEAISAPGNEASGGNRAFWSIAAVAAHSAYDEDGFEAAVMWTVNQWDVTALTGCQRRERPGDENAVGRVEGHGVDAVAHVGRALSPAVWSVGDLPRQAWGGGRDDVRVVAQLGTEVNGRVCHSSCPSAVQDVSATSPDTA